MRWLNATAEKNERTSKSNRHHFHYEHGARNWNSGSKNCVATHLGHGSLIFLLYPWSFRFLFFFSLHFNVIGEHLNAILSFVSISNPAPMREPLNWHSVSFRAAHGKSIAHWIKDKSCMLCRHDGREGTSLSALPKNDSTTLWNVERWMVLHAATTSRNIVIQFNLKRFTSIEWWQQRNAVRSLFSSVCEDKSQNLVLYKTKWSG